jgi:hypothetical protein
MIMDLAPIPPPCHILWTIENDENDLLPIMPLWSFIITASRTIHSSYHTARLQATQREIVFVHNRDMLLTIPFRADWAQIKL